MPSLPVIADPAIANQADAEVQLSPREWDVLHLLALGKSNKMIAMGLGLSENTVRVYVRAILRKLEVSNRTEAALWCRDQGATVPRAAA